MMRRKLQTVGWIAALLCCAVLWTTPVMAEEVKYELWIAGKQVTSENCTNISKENGFDGVTVAEGGECRYDNEKRTLFMKNVTIEAGDGHSAVANGSIFNLKIKVEGKNYWKATDRSALYNGLDATRITGEEGNAELVVTSKDSAAVCAKKTVGVEHIDFNATGKWGVLGKDPNDRLCNFALHFAKGTITATGTEENECAVSNVWEMGYNDDVLIREPIITPTEGGYKDPVKFFVDKDGKKVKRIQFDRKYPLNITTGYVDVDNCNNIPADPQFKYITVANGGHLYYKHDIKTLFMKDVTIESDRLVCAIMNDGIEGLTIHLEGKNIWSVEQKGIVCLASTKITGNGTLTLTIRPNAYSLCGFGIEPNKDHPNVTVDVSDITIEAHTPILLHSDPSKTTGKYILNNVKATVHGALKNCECTFKGCKIVSAEGASPIEIDRIRVESLSFSPAELIRYVGDAPAAVPQPTVNPEDAGNKRMKWTSDNEEVAKVNEEGMLIYRQEGDGTPYRQNNRW